MSDNDVIHLLTKELVKHLLTKLYISKAHYTH